MNRKKILFIEFLTFAAANHLLMMIRGLLKKSDCTIVLLCQKNSYIAQQLKKQKVSVYEIDYIELNLHETGTYYHFIKNIWLIFKIIFRHRINVIHIHRLNWAYLRILPSLILNIPIFIHIVIIEKLTSRFQNLLLKIHKRIKFIAVSKDSERKFIDLYQIPISRVTHHYGGLFFPDLIEAKNVKVPVFEKLIKKNKILVGMVTRMDPLKGVDIFIESAGILLKKFPDLHFVHIGNHPEIKWGDDFYGECLKRIKNLGIERNITFIDYMDNILPVYKYFYIAVLPTKKDTLSYMNLEANFYRVPVVFTDVDGLIETSKPEFGCSIPFPPSPVILAERIEHLLLDKRKYNILKNKIYNFVYQNFDSEKNSQSLLKIYK